MRSKTIEYMAVLGPEYERYAQDQINKILERSPFWWQCRTKSKLCRRITRSRRRVQRSSANSDRKISDFRGPDVWSVIK